MKKVINPLLKQDVTREEWNRAVLKARELEGHSASESLYIAALARMPLDVDPAKYKSSRMYPNRGVALLAIRAVLDL